MLKLPKGLKKKKKGKKSKRKDEDLFTSEELEEYRRQQQQRGQGSGENEEWSKFQDLTTGVDSVLRRTQGDLDRIKSTSYFQRVSPGVRDVDEGGRARPPPRPAPAAPAAPRITAADLRLPAAAAAAAAAPSDASSEEESDEEDVFDTSYVEAAERGEVRLGLVPDSPDAPDDSLFDTSHVDALIRGAERPRARRPLDIGVAVEVLTGRIDSVQLPLSRRPRPVPGDLLLAAPAAAAPEPQQLSILDADEGCPITTPIDLSVSLAPPAPAAPTAPPAEPEPEEEDEFTLLAAESLEAASEAVRVEEKEIRVEPVVQESWSAFEANKNPSVFAESIAEDQLDVDPYLYEDDPFDTSFADAVAPAPPRPAPPRPAPPPARPAVEEDDDFDPRADELAHNNNRRKSSVRIHLTDPSGERESITSDDAARAEPPDLLAGSCADLAALAPLRPREPADLDPFDTSLVERAAAPGRTELQLLERELIGPAAAAPAPAPLPRVPSDPDFDPRAEERRASRPECLGVGKSVGFAAGTAERAATRANPPTPYYRAPPAAAAPDELGPLPRARSDEDLRPRPPPARRPSEQPPPLLDAAHSAPARVLTPAAPPPLADPFDTSFAGGIAPSRTELRLLAKEFSCEDAPAAPRDLLDPSDEFFEVKALSPEPPGDLDPFDTSFADLQPGRGELRQLESELLH